VKIAVFRDPPVIVCEYNLGCHVLRVLGKICRAERESDWREEGVLMALQEIMGDGKCSQSSCSEIRNRESEKERDHL